MINQQSTITVRENALVQVVGDEMVILDAQSGQYYTLNEMATVILEQFKEGHSVAEVVDHVCNEYEVGESEVQEDIHSMLSTLIGKELVLLVN